MKASESGAGSGPSAPRPVPLPLLLALVGLVHLGILIPFFITAPHTGGDNGGYLALANTLLEQGRYLEAWDPGLPPHTKYPPVYPLVLAGAILLGAGSWATFKALSLVAVLGTVLLSMTWARRRLGTAAGVGVALVLAFSEAFLWASSWILSEPLFLLLTLAAVVALGREEGGVVPRTRWLVAGMIFATLALFTRTAGLPLAAAVGVWLLLRRAWVPAAGFAAMAGIPLLLWTLRGRGLREEGYLSEFWLIDPYTPEAGTVGLPGLLARAWDNLLLYGGTYIPGGLIGGQGAWVVLLGVVLLLLALTGWVRAVKKGVGPVELFVPLYTLLILLWPAVWSGDRFALPLYPFLLVYAAGALAALARPAGRGVAVGAGVAAILVMLVPAGTTWWSAVPTSAACRAVVAREGPFACYAAPVRELAEAARWSGALLPPEAVVFTRKPRLFFVLSAGIRSLTYPLSPDPDGFFAAAEAAGIRYLLYDRMDALAPSYLLPVLEARPERFCALTGWGDPGGARTELLGILPAGREGSSAPEQSGEEDAITIPRCGPDYVAAIPREEIPYGSSVVPLLDRTRNRLR